MSNDQRLSVKACFRRIILAFACGTFVLALSEALDGHVSERAGWYLCVAFVAIKFYEALRDEQPELP